MSIGVISAMAAAGGNAPTSASAATGGEGMSGEFAALLSNELTNLLATLPTAVANGLPSQGKDSSKIDPLDLEALGGLADPALIASLAGNPQFQPETSNRENGIFLTPGQTGKSNSENVLAIIDGKVSVTSSESDPRTSAKAELGAFEKISLAGSNNTNAAGVLPLGVAANIAGELAPQETNTAALSNTMGSLAMGRQAPEAQASNQQNVNAPLRDSSWPQQFGERIVWLAKNDQQTAQININPPQLGPVQITINLSGDQASLAFASPHSEVRQAIESALPQLKELLSSAGINLGQANVGANLSQNPGNHSNSADENRLANETAILRANDNATSTSASAVLQRGRGLVDLFA